LYVFFPSVYIIFAVLAFMLYLFSRYYISKIHQREVQLLNTNRTKDRFFSIIAHDLRNPITALLNLATIFQDNYNTMTTKQVKHSTDILIKSVTHTGKLLENLLEWSRVNMQTLQINLGQIYIDNILQVVINDLTPQAAVKNIQLITHIDGFEEQIVNCDADMIQTVIRNLISNSIKFTQNDKQITISVDNYSKDNNYIVVSIKDQGVGMSQETIKKLFRIDEKVSTQGTNKEVGTGLGLILCKEFIVKHKCKI